MYQQACASPETGFPLSPEGQAPSVLPESAIQDATPVHIHIHQIHEHVAGLAGWEDVGDWEMAR